MDTPSQYLNRGCPVCGSPRLDWLDWPQDLLEGYICPVRCVACQATWEAVFQYVGVRNIRRMSREA